MRWLTQLSACGCFFCLGTIYLLWPTPQAELWQCMAEPFHQLIAPYPLSATLCEVTAPENTIPDNGTYQIKLRIVSVIYGHSDAPIPPLSGYVSDYQEFMDGIEGMCAAITGCCLPGQSKGMPPAHFPHPLTASK